MLIYDWDWRKIYNTIYRLNPVSKMLCFEKWTGWCFYIKTGQWMMSKNIVFVLLYHCCKLLELTYVSMFEFPCWHITAGCWKLNLVNFITDDNGVCHELMTVCPCSHSKWVCLCTDCVHHIITTTETVKHWTFFNLGIIAHTHATSMVTIYFHAEHEWLFEVVLLPSLRGPVTLMV